MDRSAPRAAPTGARGHRGRYVFQALVVAFAATMVAGLLLVVAHDGRAMERFDLTATRAHELSPQTRAILNNLRGPTRLVIAANFAQGDRQSVRRLRDVDANFARASDRLTVDEIDTARPEGVTRFEALMSELVEMERPLIDRHAAAVNTALEALESTAAVFDKAALANERMTDSSVASVARDTKQSDSERTATIDKLKSNSGKVNALLHQLSDQLRSARQRGTKSLGEMVEGVNVPKLPEAAAAARAALAGTMSPLTRLADEAEKLGRGEGQGADAAVKEESAALAARLALARDRAARALAALDNLPPLRVLAIASTLRRTQAALVIGPADAAPAGGAATGLRVTALPIDELLPAPRLLGDGTVAPALDQRKQAEARLAAALVAMTGRPRPLVVIVQGLQEAESSLLKPLSKFVETLAFRGIDTTEWSAAREQAVPAPIAQALAANRPVVFIVFSMRARTTQEATQLGLLTKATQMLIDDGRNVLLNVSPSSTAAAGATDGMVSFLKPLGLEVLSGKPLLYQAQANARRTVSASAVLTTPEASSDISAPLEGLALLLPWCSPMRLTPAPGVKSEAIVRERASASVWAESEWQVFMETESQRAAPSRLPALDSPSDDAGSAGAPGEHWWTLAAALERQTRGERQRIVVVGSNVWLFDAYAAAVTNVQGQEAQAYPGNWELALGSINWLAGREELIARGTEAEAIATIPNLSDGQLSSLRWGLTLGVPMLVLLIGAALRVLRG
ncbi:hypothetical protein BH11PLA1_BH11PLA1_14290 [soil metagenome]